MLGKVPAQRLALIERIVKLASRRRTQVRAPLAASFIRAYYHGVAEEDLRERALENLAAAALAHLALGARRKPGVPLIRVFNPDPATDGWASRHTIVAVVTDDMPFLVDSLGIVFKQQECAVHLIVHPVIHVERNARGDLRGILDAPAKGARTESWQLFEIDRETDPVRLDQIAARLRATLYDVRIAVADWQAMRQRLRDLAAGLKASPPPLPKSEVREATALVDWMEANHFTLLGYRHYTLEHGRDVDLLKPDVASGLGILRSNRPGGSRPRVTKLTGDIRKSARERELLVITKANSVATVHRASYLDYVSLKTFDGRGTVKGEHRFLGLWTSSAYSRSPREIPVLRHKVSQVFDHFGLASQSHDAKAVMHVLETFPRDELFQASVADLIAIVRGIVNLYERQQVRLFVRRDPFRRFYSCFVYVPRDRYNTEVRRRIEALALEAFHGKAIETQVQLSDSVLARAHMLVRTDPDDNVEVDAQELERRMARAVRTWWDAFRDALTARFDEGRCLTIARRFERAFPAAYQAGVTAAEALADVEILDTLDQEATGLRTWLCRSELDPPAQLHLKLYRRAQPIPISDVLPMMENMGLKVISEQPYALTLEDGATIWIQDFKLEHRAGTPVAVEAVRTRLLDTFTNVWFGRAENDGFNRLVLAAGLDWRQTTVLRAICRYIVQTGIPFSQAYMEQVLADNAKLGAILAQLFATQFDPALETRARSVAVGKLAKSFNAGIEKVARLDEDRILRAFRAVVAATLRTNFFQKTASGEAKPYLSFKLDPQKIPELPLPRPMFEIFVYSPRVEGVHLRKGHVARGGIRWSDRREDFRTEVLGLMKAQHVKNTLIVPVGAKGGFFPKRLPAAGRDEIQREVIACYQTFIRGLLDLTDNIVRDRIVPPAATVRRDGDDAYLVVAADKGTATFSDIANALSAEYGFWLGDAFASGGSAGYDHKKMAITARGGWESVKRHFREMGIDTQSQDFTVAGIGDMAGDVFGNGLLQSKHIRLLAAFNHQHIFLDPNAVAASSFPERERLFNLPRSSWEDYNRKRISKGGGIYSRQLKSITLSGEAQRMLGLASNSVPPQEIIRAILRMPVELLWNGGIGTYVKATAETHLDIGDRANDGVRVNGKEVAAKVIGEGGNLGCSQRGRVEYALKGGRINTDFIDNSAGVNCSDVEVNIKILLNAVVAGGRLLVKDRNRLLASMTREVAGLVLRNNYLQSQAVSTLEAQARERLPEHVHVMRALERSGELNAALEYLPNDEAVDERRKLSKGLTRPELAVILSYSKIWLYNKLIHSDVPEDKYLSRELVRYFPVAIQKRYGRELRRHRLRREIIATATTNSLVNRMGPVFAIRTQQDTGAEVAQIARAYSIAREVCAMRELWAEIESLDNRIEASAQYAMMNQTSRLLRHMTYRLLADRGGSLGIEERVSRMRPGVVVLSTALPGVLVGAELASHQSKMAELAAAGINERIARQIANLAPLNSALDIVEIAAAAKISVPFAARVYFLVGDTLSLDWLREQIERLSVEGHWQAVARSALRDNLHGLQRSIVGTVLGTRRQRGSDPAATVAAWVAARRAEVEHLQQSLKEMKAGPAADFPTLSVALQAVRRLAPA
ncbi:MAG TPA: NAD-glutamate dehydrogenase [Steroidobacteraceae bacterium]|nr:NAD-glutamate dehydrogenase [Steroidobacteraceae bacterium]